MAVIHPPYVLPELRPFRTIENRLRLQGGAVITQNGTLQSDDYRTGTSGWVINGQGDVEFNDGTFRGEIDASALNIIINEADDGSIEFYSNAGNLVGRLAAGAWEIGDLQTPGLRAQLDPVGGLRFRSAIDQLLNLVDQNGMSIRDDGTGIVTAELTGTQLRLEDIDGSTRLQLSAVSDDILLTPRYKGVYEANPATTFVIPAATLLSPSDLSLGHTASWRQKVNQTPSHTPPAGWTEVIDDRVGTSSSLAIAVARRAPATGAAGTVTSTLATWDNAVGTHAIVKGITGSAPPTVRATSDIDVVTTATKINVAIAKPPGTVAGDVLVVFISMGNSGGGVPVGWTTPEGWKFLGATLGTVGVAPNQSTLAVGCWAYLAGPAEPGSYNTNINFGVGTKTIHATMVAVEGAAVVDGGAIVSVNGLNILGPWQTYTPVHINVTPGAGPELASYMLMGKTCHVRYSLTYTASTVFTGSSMEFGLPFPAAAGAQAMGSCRMLDAGTKEWVGMCRIGASGTGVRLFHSLDTGTGNLAATVPFAWAANDVLDWSLTYEIA